MTRQTDAPTASVFDANSYALQHAARTMPDGSRSIRLLKIIPGTSVTHGARSTCWSPPKARSHSGNQPATRVSYPPAAGRSNDKNPSAWSNASSHGDTTFIAGSWPGYSAQCSRPEEVSGLLADVGQMNGIYPAAARNLAAIGAATAPPIPPPTTNRSEEHTSELQSRQYLVCRLLLE